MSDIWAIILAAGESKRMGFPKMLLSFDGRPMIENVIGKVKSSGIDHIIVILGADSGILSDIVNLSGVISCYNDNYKTGMLSSVICGFRNLPLKYEAVLVFQGDQPLISATVIKKVIKGYKISGKGIVVPVCGTKRGHPLLIDAKYRDEIGHLKDNEGLRSLALKFSEDVLEVESDDPGILRDFDTYADYLKEINQKK